MHDLTAILTKFLPVVVIGALVGMFYLLDVFSVGTDTESVVPARAESKQAVTPSPVVPTSTQESVPESAPPPAAATPISPSAVVTPIPPAAQPTNVPPPLPTEGPAFRAIESPPMNSSPRYLPPPGASQPQPLASENTPSETPSELPVHEIVTEDGELIDAETRKAMEQPEAPSPGGGGDG